MNNLSWLIYLSGLAVNLGPVLGITAIIWVAGSFIKTLMDEKPSSIFPTWLVIGWFVGLTVFVLIPSQTTVGLIAASELGEKAVNSQQFSDLLKKAIGQ